MTQSASLTIFDSTDDGDCCPTCKRVLEPLSDLHGKQLGPFAKDSDTSRKAALLAYPATGSQRERVLRALSIARMTRDELADFTGLTPNAVRPRVRELMDGGWVFVTDLTRPTATGRDAEVLALTVRARARLAEGVAA